MVDSNQTAGPSHEAFPAASHRQQAAVALPESEQELWALITSSSQYEDIQQSLLPVLQGLSLEAKKGNKRVQEILSIPSVEINGASDEQLAAHTLGLVYVLSARLARTKKDAGSLRELSMRLALSADPAQLLMSPETTDFAWGLLRLAKKDNEVPQVLSPLLSLLDKTTSGQRFRGVHAVYLEACLLTRNTTNAVPTLTLYDSVFEGTSYRDVLTYFHHAGTIAAQHELYDQATAFFISGAAMPANVVSAIQLACAKRALLTQLLDTGTKVQWPSDTSGPMNRALESRSLEKSLETYTKLADAFSNADWAQVRQKIAAGQSALEHDGNWSLAERVQQSITKRRILGLRKVYTRMPLAVLASKVEATEDEVKSWLELMITRRQICASISAGNVTFEEENYTSQAHIAKLREAQVLADWVNKDLDISNRNMSLDRKWLMKQVNSIDSKEKGRDPLTSRGGDIPAEATSTQPVRGAGSNFADLGF